jgi:hypothetical protein
VACIFLIGGVELCIRAERRQKGGFVIRAAPHPAIRQPRPFGNCIARADQIFRTARRAEKLVRKAAVAGIGRTGQHCLLLRVMQCIVEAGNHAGCVAERRVGGDIFDTLAIDPDFAPIPQTFQILLAGEGQCRSFYRFDGHSLTSLCSHYLH